MKFQEITGNFADANVEALAVAVFKGEKPSAGGIKDLDKMTGGLVAGVFKDEGFKGEAGEFALIRFTPKSGAKASKLLLLGVGDEAEYKNGGVAVLAGTAARLL